MTQRYDRMAERLGIKTTLHNLRHYSATELISAGVDLRTVAGRLGHSGGGATTLRRYAAWVAEADQRAAITLKGRMPTTPPALIPEDKPGEPTTAEDGTARSSATNPPAGTSSATEQDPYHRIASDLRAAIACGALTSAIRSRLSKHLPPDTPSQNPPHTAPLPYSPRNG